MPQRKAIWLALALLLVLPQRALPAEAPQAPYYAAGARSEGAVAIDMASLKRSGQMRSVRVWQFSPTPVYTSTGFKAGDVQTIEFDCAAERVRFVDRGIFTSLEHIELQPKTAEEWFNYKAPHPLDNSLATTVWVLLCGNEVPVTWVAYNQLDMIALDYWSSLVPEPVDGTDAHGVEPPKWAGPNAAQSTIPKPPEPILPW